MFKKAVVLGASGGMGYSIVNELAERGTEVVAFSRSKEKLQRLFDGKEHVQIISGDVFQLDDLIKACEGAEVIFHAVNIPYPEWPNSLPKIMENVLKTAEVHQAKVVIVDNVYAYGRSNGQRVSEDHVKNPHTKKGKIRLQLEQMAKKAHQQGVPTLIIHYPDFYGPNAVNTIMHYTLDTMLRDKSTQFVGNQSVKREYVYTPDGAKAAVELALNESAYGQNWNVPGYDVISGEEIIELARKYTGYRKKVGTVSKGMISFLGLFNANMREVKEMMYLYEEPVTLSGEKYERFIGPLPKTPYEEGIRNTLEYMKQASAK